MTWQPIDENTPKDRPIRIYAPSTQSDDFNPTGTVEACWDEIAAFNENNENVPGWLGAVWNPEQDHWDAVHITDATHWQEITAPDFTASGRNMLNPASEARLNSQLEQLVLRAQMEQNEFTTAQIVACIKQALECGDFILHIQQDTNASGVTYQPAAQVERLRSQLAAYKAAATDFDAWLLAHEDELCEMEVDDIARFAYRAGAASLLKPGADAPRDGTPIIAIGYARHDLKFLRACITAWHKKTQPPVHAEGFFYGSPGYCDLFDPILYIPLETVMPDAPKAWPFLVESMESIGSIRSIPPSTKSNPTTQQESPNGR